MHQTDAAYEICGFTIVAELGGGETEGNAVAMESERLLIDHWDPADRFIAAAARVLDATLVTADERFVEAANLKVLANR